MTKSWFHVTSYNVCWGFAINNKNIVVEVAPIAFKELYNKSVKDPAVRKWFIDNELTVIPIDTDDNDTQAKDNTAVL